MDATEVFYCYTADINYNDMQKELGHILCHTEQERLSRFRFNKDKKSFLISHLLARIVLGRKLSINPKKISYLYTSSGKPYIKDNPVFFNMSNTAMMSSLIINKRYACGIDNEHINQNRDFMDIATNYFGINELEKLKKTEINRQAEYFYSLWALKEACLKCRGDGLNISPDKVQFVLAEKHIEALFTPSLNENISNWHFNLKKMEYNCLLATALKIPDAHNIEISYNKVTQSTLFNSYTNE
ncbi:MAG: 4'-phosphopantetheinyl transferase superfamily protein [Gammaproteobacteria bacterium]|nr:MAG: 4'-phosphopantetheinyl transferase superfamily protein [Gammaproteobacteria bacterium]